MQRRPISRFGRSQQTGRACSTRAYRTPVPRFAKAGVVRFGDEPGSLFAQLGTAAPGAERKLRSEISCFRNYPEGDLSSIGATVPLPAGSAIVKSRAVP